MTGFIEGESREKLFPAIHALSEAWYKKLWSR
jgi:hypothetical protein